MLTVEIQGELVEHAAAGLLADVVVHRLAAQLVEAHGVGERLGGGGALVMVGTNLGARLHGEHGLDRTKGEALAVHGADGHGPVGRIVLG